MLVINAVRLYNHLKLLPKSEASDVRDKYVRDQRMFGTICNFATSKYNFVTINVSFNAYACGEVHFVANFILSRTYVPKSSRHEVTFHLKFDREIAV